MSFYLSSFIGHLSFFIFPSVASGVLVFISPRRANTFLADTSGSKRIGGGSPLSGWNLLRSIAARQDRRGSAQARRPLIGLRARCYAPGVNGSGTAPCGNTIGGLTFYRRRAQLFIAWIYGVGSQACAVATILRRSRNARCASRGCSMHDAGLNFQKGPRDSGGGYGSAGRAPGVDLCNTNQKAGRGCPGASCSSSFVRMFKPQFAGLVERGEKTQTVRPTPKRMPKTGDHISLRAWSDKPYRSKQKMLAEGIITHVDRIEITNDGVTLLPESSVNLRVQVPRGSFAVADGFSCWEDMRQWFEHQHGLPFSGVLIRWTNARPPAHEDGPGGRVIGLATDATEEKVI